MWVTGTGGVLGVPRVLLDMLIGCLWGWFVVRSKVKMMIFLLFFLVSFALWCRRPGTKDDICRYFSRIYKCHSFCYLYHLCFDVRGPCHLRNTFFSQRNIRASHSIPNLTQLNNRIPLISKQLKRTKQSINDTKLSHVLQDTTNICPSLTWVSHVHLPFRC